MLEQVDDCIFEALSTLGCTKSLSNLEVLTHLNCFTHTPIQNLPFPESYGWELLDSEYKPIMTGIIYQFLLE